MCRPNAAPSTSIATCSPARPRAPAAARRGLSRLQRHDLRRLACRDRRTRPGLLSQMAAQMQGGSRQPGGGDDRLFTFTGLPRSQWKSARTTDEIDKLFFAGSLAHVGTGWACGTARRSAFCPSKARWQRGYWDAALSTPTAAGGGGRRPAFTKPHPSSDNRPWRSRGCSVQRQSGWIAHCPLRTQFGAVVSSACTGDRGAKSKAGG